MKNLKCLSIVVLLSSFIMGCSGKSNKPVTPITPDEPVEPVEPVEPECEHNYHIDKKVDPTETSEGYILYQCGLCGVYKRVILPKLDENNYTVEELTANCIHGNGHRYTSEEYGTYEITDNERTLHSVFGERCDICHELVGKFQFNAFTSFNALGYPRIFKLSEYWNNAWLFGGDNGRIVVRRSLDEGVSWSNEVIASYMDNYSCANIDFFELPNHDIICSFRAIGNNITSDADNQYSRKLHFSLSHDGGISWEDGGDIVDNFLLAEQLGKSKQEAINAMKQEGRLGFFEPYIDLINNKPTVVYADDFSTGILKPMGSSVSLNYCTQYLATQTYDMKTNTFSKERVMMMDGTQKKSPRGSGLASRISRDGMPVYTRMKDGTYVVVFEGTYRDRDYPSFTGETLEEYHPFEILLSYSKDGINWANPVEIYIPKNNGSKASAPFVCVNEKDQLVVSFQTDEDAVPSGYIGDAYSVMKCMVAKEGIAIEDIDKDSFYAVTNVNNTPVGGASLWNGMMVLGNTLYTCSSGNPIRRSDIPVYANKEDYIKEIKIEGETTDIELIEDNFTTYSSNSNIYPLYEEGNLILNNTSHAEQKLIFNEIALDGDYQIDFDLSSTSDRNVNTGLYLNAINPQAGTDLITAMNIHLERMESSKGWSIHAFKFNQAYNGEYCPSTSMTSESYDIHFRMVVIDKVIRVMIDDMTEAAFIFDASNYDIDGVLGIRNQGTAKATISNFQITR